jgi:bifunctional UDP-N-acetylglucosamine pyrophosphorylase/glucosamine-1-phosphate N-acetyltransferase
MSTKTIVILAAGLSTRMNSGLPKVMHPISGRPALGYILETANNANPNKVILITSPNMDNVRDYANSQYAGIIHAIQETPLGTGDAVKYALPYIDMEGDCIILYGDSPFIKLETINKLYQKKSDLVMIGFNSNKPNQYGRIVTFNQDVLEIVEFNDATEEERAITLCNSGIYSIKNIHLHELIPLIKNHNAKKEFYLTDIVKLAAQKDITCTVLESTEMEVMGFNSREELSFAEEIMQENIKSNLMYQGVSIINPKSSYIAYDFQAEKDVTIYPNVFIGNNVTAKNNVEIRSFSHLEGVNIHNNVVIGPFARIRPNTELADNVKIGNFVEIKNSNISNHSKINHLSYIGDTSMGNNCNVGAGTITCNFDGIKTKSKTNIGDNVSIGSNCSLIAPISISNGSFIAAGSVITKDTAEDDLAIARAEQVNLTGKAKNLRHKK